MYPGPSRLRLSTLALILVGTAAQLPGQIQLKAPYDGAYLPILSRENGTLFVSQDGHKRCADSNQYEVQPATSFGEGFVTITDIESDLDASRGLSSEEKARPGTIRFRYRAKITPDRPLSDCYAVLTTITEGSVGTQIIGLRRLDPGKPTPILLELSTPIESVGTLHVFSRALEIKSTQHPAPYDASAYFDGLAKSAKGLSAAALLKSAEEYPYALSPNGHYLAAALRRDAKKWVVVYDLLSMKVVYEKPAIDFDRYLGNFKWVSDHEFVYVADDPDERAFERSHGYRNRYLTHNLYRIDLTSGTPELLEDDVLDIWGSVASQPDILVLHCWDNRSDSWTEKYNVHTRQAYDIKEPDAGYYYMDRNGVDRIKMRYDGDSIFYEVRPKPDSRWRDLDSIVKQPGLHFNRKGSEILDRVVDLHSVGPDGDTLYLSTRLNSDRFELVAFSMSTGLIKNTIAKHPRYDLTTTDFGLTRLLFAKKTTQVLGIIFEAQKPQVVWIDPRFAAAQRALDTQFPDHVNLPLDWTDDASAVIYLSFSDQDPGTIYIFQPDQHRIIPILIKGDKLKGFTLAKTTPIEFTARDGHKIPAYVTRPPNPGPGPAPLIVDIHGGPTARNSWYFNPTAQFFASRGYIVLQVNYRGSSGFGSAFQAAGLRARLDTVVLDDIADGARHLVETGEADPTRVGVMGASFGGWATYMCLIKYPDLFRAGVAISAIAHWRDTLRDDRRRFENKLGYSFWKSLLDRTDFSSTEKFIDPYLRASEIHQPIFIIHGDRDSTVSSLQAGAMIDALKKQNSHVQSHNFSFATHTDWSFEDEVVKLNEIGLFFEKYLAPAPPATAVAH